MAEEAEDGMTSTQYVPFTGHELYITGDRPALYLSPGEGNTPGVTEVHLHLYDPEHHEDRPLGWVNVQRLRDALDAIT